jgi:hypothetical protein
MCFHLLNLVIRQAMLIFLFLFLLNLFGCNKRTGGESHLQAQTPARTLEGLLNEYISLTSLGPLPDWQLFSPSLEGSDAAVVLQSSASVWNIMEKAIPEMRKIAEKGVDRNNFHESVAVLLAGMRLLSTGNPLDRNDGLHILEKKLPNAIERDRKKSSLRMNPLHRLQTCREMYILGPISDCPERILEAYIANDIFMEMCPNSVWKVPECFEVLNHFNTLVGPSRGHPYVELERRRTAYNDFIKAVDLLLYSDRTKQRDEKIRSFADGIYGLPAGGFREN